MLRAIALISLFFPFSISLGATSPFDLSIPGLTLKLRIDRLSPGAGRVVNMVYDIDQDSLGFIWFGAEDSILPILRPTGFNTGWGEPSAPVRFTILPPFWETWWFRISGVLVVVLGGFGAYRYRVNKIIEMERLRLKIASDLHDDVGRSLSNIAPGMVRRQCRLHIPHN